MVGSSSNQQSLSLVDKGPIHYAILEAHNGNIAVGEVRFVHQRPPVTFAQRPLSGSKAITLQGQCVGRVRVESVALALFVVGRARATLMAA